MDSASRKISLGPKSLSGRNKETSDGIDFYQTPAYVTEKLLNVEPFLGTIWEPCSGAGAISKVLEEAYGKERVFSSDIRTDDGVYGRKGYDFVNGFPNTRLDHFPLEVDNVITNPPFYCAKEIIENALLASRRKVAMFLKLVFLESERRYQFFQDTPLARVHVFSKRVNLYREGKPIPANSGTMAFAWFVWDKGHEISKPPTIHWLL